MTERGGRREDRRFLTGSGTYVGDISCPGQAHALVLRSPVAHARIRSVDIAAAAAIEGVIGIFTADDIGDDLGHMPCEVTLPGAEHFNAERPALARERVRFVGDSIALIVAETLNAARDAAELIELDLEEEPCVVGGEQALAQGAPLVWPKRPDNLCFDWTAGDRSTAEAALAKASHVTRLRLTQNRVVMNAIEPRFAIGEWDSATETYSLTATTQGSDLIRRLLAGPVLGVASDKLRVRTPDVGGGFGLKHYLYNEYALVLWASRRLNRPVKWSGERLDAFQTDTHGRAQTIDAALGLDADGQFVALHVETIADLGAYLSTMAPYIPTVAMVASLPVLYRMPHVFFRARGVFTHTTPVDAYRGAGRPEAVYITERLIDAAAVEVNLDPIELRRLNLIPESALPYTTATGHVYDSGRFAETMERVLVAADRDGFPDRRRDSNARGLLRGFGVANYVENTGGAPKENAELRIGVDGRIRLVVGTLSTGQGHETTFPQYLSTCLGVSEDHIDFVQGDTEDLSYGGGTGGSRSLSMAGSAIKHAADDLVARAKDIAADILECAVDDVQYENGWLHVRGTDRGIDLFDIARRAGTPGSLPDHLAGPLSGFALFERQAPTYPNGCHACEVEVDPETGSVRVVAYHSVDDFGRIINPQIVTGQVHGGVAQGIGQALQEESVYDPDSGQLLTASFMDYGIPRAGDLPNIATSFNEVPCLTNPLGVKGAGESGAIAAPPAVMNAVLQALRPLGVKHLEMPVTPAKVWRAIRHAQQVVDQPNP